MFPDALSVELLYDFPVSPIHEIRSGAVCRDSQQILTLLANARDDLTYTLYLAQLSLLFVPDKETITLRSQI